MSQIKKMFGYYEDQDGNERGPFRVTLADKLQYEKTAKARNWDADDHPFTTDLFMVWHASRRNGEHSLSFDDFRDAVVDTSLSTDDAEDTEESPIQ